MPSLAQNPASPLTRADAKAARDAFLSKNRWNDVTATWDPIQPAPRVMSALTRSQVRRETIQFLKTHNWDEEKEVWVMKPRSTIRP